MKTMILSSVVAYHGLSLRVSECGVPCIMKFIGSLMALEALILPLKTIHANLVEDVRGSSEKTAKPLPRPLAVLIGLPAALRKKNKGGDEACLLPSEVEKKNMEDWAVARFVMWMLVLIVYCVGLIVIAAAFLPELNFADDSAEPDLDQDDKVYRHLGRF
jgi:hypothetical protein